MSNARELAELGGSYGTGGFVGMKNRIINGAMMIDQRNAGAAKTVAVSSNVYTLDRWLCYCSGASITAQQVSAQSGFDKAIRLTGASGNTLVQVGQRIESANCYDLLDSQITLSANIASTSGVSVTIYAGVPAVKDDYTSSVTWSVVGIITPTTSPTNYTRTFAAPANIARGVAIVFSVDSGLPSANTVTITGVQLEKGSTATSFDFRSIGTELALCQRYYETSYSAGVAVGANDSNGRIILSGSSQASNLCLLSIPYKVSKRTNATATLYSQAGTAGTWDYERSGVNSTNTPVAYAPSTQGTNVYMNVGAAWVPVTTYGHFAVSAEL